MHDRSCPGCRAKQWMVDTILGPWRVRRALLVLGRASQAEGVPPAEERRRHRRSSHYMNTNRCVVETCTTVGLSNLKRRFYRDRRLVPRFVWFGASVPLQTHRCTCIDPLYYSSDTRGWFRDNVDCVGRLDAIDLGGCTHAAKNDSWMTSCVVQSSRW